MNLVYPIAFSVICGFLVVLPAYETPFLVLVDVLILAVGVVFYFVFVYWRKKPAFLARALRECST